MKPKAITFAAISLLVAGVCILLYPGVSNKINQCLGSYAIQSLKKELQNTDSEALELERQRAEHYNEQILVDPKEISENEYLEILNFADGMMGYIQIPDIGVDLPIYHGVSEEVLSKGVGHLPGSAIPIGGSGNHAVLTGHTGLPSAELFTHLSELTEGDIFHISVLDEVLTYRIDQIKVVLPGETGDLMPEPGEDLCTLVTCTPYGINSHRLLVRGSREHTQTNSEQTVSEQPRESFPWPMVVLTLVLIGGLFFTIAAINRRH